MDIAADIKIITHRDEDNNPTWVEVVGSGEGYHAGFQVIDGELIETTDFETHRVPGFPNFDSIEAGSCNPALAENPELVEHVATLLGVEV